MNKTENARKVALSKISCENCGLFFSRTNIKRHKVYCINNAGRPSRNKQKKKSSGRCIPWNKNKRWKKKNPENRSLLGRKHSISTKEKMSRRIKELYASGWQSTAGRCKKYKYKSPIAGSVLLDGTWELKVAKWLDFKNYNWRRNKNRFAYIKPDNKEGFYTPDFYLVDFNTYIEVKGYETELDRCKWKQFPEKLLIWKKQEIEEISLPY